jgi:hypothetical protein
MLRECSGGRIREVGDVFEMLMHNDEMGGYDSHAPEWLRKAVKGGARWTRSMTVSLEKLDELSRR